MEPRRLLSGDVFVPGIFDYEMRASVGHFVDMDADGVDDFVNTNSSNVSNIVGQQVWYGRPDGGFTPTSVTADGALVRVGIPARLNADPYLDLFVIDGSSIRARVGTPSRVFLSTEPFWTNSPSNQTLSGRLLTADVNGDGLDDAILVGTSGNRGMRVVLNSGYGFGTSLAAQPTEGLNPESASVADVDGDGNIDIVVALWGNSQPIGVAYGRGDGTFEAFVGGFGSGFVQLGPVVDMDGDGLRDLVYFRQGEGAAVTVIRARTARSYDPPVDVCQSLSSVSYPFGAGRIQLADLEGDGDLDVFAVFSDSWMEVARNEGGLSFIQLAPVPLDKSTVGFSLMDVNQDGWIDVRSISSERFSRLTLGSQTGWNTQSPPTVAIESHVDPVSADWNRDGYVDLIFRHTSTPVVTIRFGDASGSYVLAEHYSVPSQINAIQVGDVNGDNRPDLVLRGASAFFVGIQQPDGAPAPWTTYPSAAPIGDLVVIDFNSDGRDDLIALDGTLITSPRSVVTFLAQPNGTLLEVERLSEAREATKLVTGDLNADGLPDLVVLRENSYGFEGFLLAASVRLSIGGGRFGALTGGPILTGGGSGGVIADADLDGIADLIVAHHDTDYESVAARGRITVARGRGDGSFWPPISTWLPAPGFSPQVADVDGDEVPDFVLIYRSGVIDVRQWAGSGLSAGHRYATAPVPLSSTLADLNGDGRLDLPVTTSTPRGPVLRVELNLSDHLVREASVVAGALDVEHDHRVRFEFSRRIDIRSVQPADLIAVNTNTGQTFVPVRTHLRSTNRVVEFEFNQLPDGDYRFELPAGSVLDLAQREVGNGLTLEGSSVYVLAGDVNRDRAVNFADLLVLAQNYGQTGRTYSQGNIDYSPDGTVGFSDLLILAQRYGTNLIRTGPKASVFGSRSIGRRGLFEAEEAVIV